MAVDAAGNLYITDFYNSCVRKVDSNGIITNVAGKGGYGYDGDGGLATAAHFNGPTRSTLDSAGNLYVADRYNHRIRRVDASGTISTVAGNGVYGYDGDGGPATAAELSDPARVAVDAAGNLYIADTGSERIRKIDRLGIISAVTGNETAGYTGEVGTVTDDEPSRPQGLAIDGAGNLYVADSSKNRICKISY